MVSQLMDLIIPDSDIPGAIELKLPEFLDGFIDVIMNEKAQKKRTEGWDQEMERDLTEKGKSNERRKER